jgi:hypothetical protein
MSRCSQLLTFKKMELGAVDSAPSIVAVEPFHLERYGDEQVFRYDSRATKDNPLNDSDRFDFAMCQIARKRLTYAELTGKPRRASPDLTLIA